MTNSNLERSEKLSLTTDAPESSDELAIRDVIVGIWCSRWKIAGISIAFTVVGIAASLIMTPIFRATTTIMPPQQQQSTTTMMLAALGGSGAGGGLSAALGIKNPNDIFVAMFKSKRVRNEIINKYNLIQYYKVGSRTDAMNALNEATNVFAEKEGMIKVQFDDKDPILAQKVANSYVDELKKLTQELSVSEASERRKYFEELLAQAKDSLASAEGAFRIFQEHTGMIDVDAQGKVSGEAMGELRKEIAMKEIEIKTLSGSVTSQNPIIKKNQLAVAGMRKQLESLTGLKSDDVWIAKGKAPQLGLEYSRKLRDVKYYEAIFEITAKQYEFARMDESKNGMIIQVVDRAEIPEQRERPKRALIAVLSLMFGVATALLYSYILAVRPFQGVFRAKPNAVESEDAR